MPGPLTRQRTVLQIVGILLSFSILMTACSNDISEPNSEASMTSHENLENEIITTDSGYTQEEQLAEVAFVLEVMREHFGGVGFRDLSDDADIEEVREHVKPESCGNDHYRYHVDFEVDERDDQELYDKGQAVAEQLGLSANRNNSDGSNDGMMLYGAGLAEDRLFQVNGVGGKLTVFYRGRCSDHETMQKVVQDFADQRLEELEENAPTHLPGYGE